jgi:hypothetical protein
MFKIYFHAKFVVHSSSVSFVIAVKLKATYKSILQIEHLKKIYILGRYIITTYIEVNELTATHSAAVLVIVVV